MHPVQPASTLGAKAPYAQQWEREKPPPSQMHEYHYT